MQRSNTALMQDLVHGLIFIYLCRHWLKVIVSLVIVMGISWLGQLVFFADQDVILYIVHVFTVCQGIIIFILLVPLSKQVHLLYHLVSLRAIKLIY